MESTAWQGKRNEVNFIELLRAKWAKIEAYIIAL